MMTRYHIECEYCGNRWKEHVLKLRELKCSICKETKLLKTREVNTDKVDYYKGDDEFPKDKVIKNKDIEGENVSDYILDWPHYD